MFRFPPVTPVVKVWLATTLATLVALMVATNFLGMTRMAEMLALVGSFGPHTAWQVITWPLAQPPNPQGLTGYLISALFFWLVAAPFELQWGSKKLVQLMVVITLGAGATALLAGLLIRGGGVFGFGPHVLGVIAAYAWAIRHQGQLSFFGVLPMKAIHLIFLCVFLSLLQFLASRDVMSFAADLGAVGVAILFMRRLERRPPKPKKPKKPKKKRSASHMRVIEGGKQWMN